MYTYFIGRGGISLLDIYICEDNLKQLAFIKEKVENIIAFEELDIKIKTADK